MRDEPTIEQATSWTLRFPLPLRHRNHANSHIDLVGVTLRDSVGVQGTGFTFSTEHEGSRAVRELLDQVMLPRVRGRRSIDTRAVWGDLQETTSRMGRGATMMAISAIDIALWDLQGHQRDLPLADVIGRVRDTVPAYGSGKAAPGLPLGELVDASREHLESGVRAIKIRVGLNVDEDVARVRALRSEFGDGIRIMCDANQRLDLATAIWLGNQFAQEGVFWLEEPLPAGQVEAHARLTSTLPMSIAVGEHLFNRYEFMPYVSARAVDILQPDACMVGGVTEFMRIGDLATAHGFALAPHFLAELHIHLAAAFEKSLFVERFPFIDEFLTHRLTVQDGEALVPDRPGHGIEFVPEAWRDHQVG